MDASICFCLLLEKLIISCHSLQSKENFLYDMEMQPSNKRPSKDKNKDTSIHDEHVQQEKANTSADKVSALRIF